MRSICQISLLSLFLVGGALTAADRDRTPAPLPAEEAAQSFQVPEGFHVTLVAAEPDIVQPVSFCFDDRGRLFVAEALNYGQWQPTGRDRIVILEDRDGDGRSETRTLFYEGLNYVTGIEIGFGGVWVMSPPSLYFIPDRDRDDRPDGPPEVLFDGFGHKESRHNLANGFTWGPDGWLYAGHGRTSPSDVGRPGTPAEQRVHCDGGVYRIHPTRLVFENFADGTTNPWGVDFDDFGQCFVSNCVNPHLFHVIQGAHYEPWRNRPSSLYAYDRIATIADHLHYPTGKPDAMRGETDETLAMGGGHAHCGTLVYLGDTFPDRYRNTVFMCNVHGRRINHDLLRRVGSGYVASHLPDWAISRDPWFMGVTLRTGPDGSVYVSDWSDTGECHSYNPERGTGRIFRIQYGDKTSLQVDLAALTDQELVELQMHDNDWYVRHARRLLQERAARSGWDGAAIHAQLREQFSSAEETRKKLRALWALRVTGGLSPADLAGLLANDEPYVRAWGIQFLCEPSAVSAEISGRLAELAADDPSPVVRLYLAAALQRLPLEQRLPIAQGLVGRAEDNDDQNLPLMIWYGLEPAVPALGERTLKLALDSRLSQVTEFLARRFVEHAIGAGEGSGFEPLVEVLAAAEREQLLPLLRGAREGLKGRKQVPLPTGWEQVYEQLLRESESDSEIEQLVVELALAFGDRRAAAAMSATARDRTATVKRRIAALETLIAKGGSDVSGLLHSLLDDPALRRTAIRGLAVIAHEETPARLLERYSEFSSEEKQDVIATLSSRREFAVALVAALETNRLPTADVTAYAARQIQALGDRDLTGRLRHVWGEIRDRGPQKREQLARLQTQLSAEVLARADLGQGRLLFSKSCQQCHRLFGEGAAIGPDLTGSNRKNLEYLLSNLVDPSAEIGRDYRMSVVTTNAGRVLTGMVLENSPARLSLQTATERVVLPRDEVEEVQDSKVSMMPEGQLDAWTIEQIRDLIGYLQSPRQAEMESDSNW